MGRMKKITTSETEETGFRPLTEEEKKEFMKSLGEEGRKLLEEIAA